MNTRTKERPNEAYGFIKFLDLKQDPNASTEQKKEFINLDATKEESNDSGLGDIGSGE
ncbi:hypothetical protein QA612_02565 [Evansella sp. AB-P1]|uniref:hypothetical protein n=1 Tax=Evansella sp. AB-P1 TaxID=3037653 RepID=UPI00241C146F|nr:hypothetical protein [Evansella sp. AB-P1]MDG5786358.1 hypothetical protein [Evansella sp. AB-P1]